MRSKRVVAARSSARRGSHSISGETDGQEAITTELKAKLQARDAEATALEAKLKAQEVIITGLKPEGKLLHMRIARLKARLANIYTSRSWRITAPLRAISRGFRWLVRNTGRALKLTSWLVTGQFGRAAKALLPYYRRYAKAIAGLSKIAGATPAPSKTLELHAEEKIVGARPWRAGARTVLLCAHHAGGQIFGGERSFIDVASSFLDIGWNVVVTLPHHVNSAYVAHLREHAQGIRIFPYNRWSSDAKKSLLGVNAFLRAMRDVGPDLVYVNTIVVKAPLVAARMLNIPTIVHAREIIQHDQWLQKPIGLDAETIVRQIAHSADRIVANSLATARSFHETHNVTIFPNVINGDAFNVPNDASGKELRFGLVSSNIPKKGISDFVRLAKFCLSEVPDARFVIVGPKNRAQQTLRSGVGEDSLPDNVELVDYKSSSIEAVQQANVIVNFSHFQESFGRTILEGMAARRPSIAYAWGALPELIASGTTGFLVPYLKPEQAVPFVRKLCQDRALVTTMGEAARQRAIEHYAPARLQERLRGTLVEIFECRAATGSKNFAEVRTERLKRQAARTIDIVVCVHNALEDTKSCLESVARHIGASHRIIIVDDGSDTPTQQFLQDFAKEQPRTILHRNSNPLGYTRSANIGLSLSSAELVILLNSDTIVTSSWADKMADAVFSTPGAGIVGPMSNAASYQSLPEVASTKRQTAVNNLPIGISPEDMNRQCEEWTREGTVPYVPLVHGFCFGITRETLDRLGGFDEKLFPDGYGEENDFCLRALECGIWPVIATHTFVFHAKSKSYSETRRYALSEKAQEVLHRRHGRRQFLEYVTLLQKNPILEEMRRKAGELFRSPPALARKPHTFATTG